MPKTGMEAGIDTVGGGMGGESSLATVTQLQEAKLKDKMRGIRSLCPYLSKICRKMG